MLLWTNILCHFPYFQLTWDIHPWLFIKMSFFTSEWSCHLSLNTPTYLYISGLTCCTPHPQKISLIGLLPFISLGIVVLQHMNTLMEHTISQGLLGSLIDTDWDTSNCLHQGAGRENLHSSHRFSSWYWAWFDPVCVHSYQPCSNG